MSSSSDLFCAGGNYENYETEDKRNYYSSPHSSPRRSSASAPPRLALVDTRNTWIRRTDQEGSKRHRVQDGRNVLTYDSNNELDEVGETQYKERAVVEQGNDESPGLQMLSRAIDTNMGNSMSDEYSQELL